MFKPVIQNISCYFHRTLMTFINTKQQIYGKIPFVTDIRYHNTDLEEGKSNPRVQLQDMGHLFSPARCLKWLPFIHSHWHSSYTHQAPPPIFGFLQWWL